MTDTIDIRGLKELDAAMKDLPTRVQKQVLGRAVAKGAGEIKKVAKQLIRQRGAVDTGALLRNVRTKRGKRPKQTVVRYMVGVEHGKVRPVDSDGRIKTKKGSRRATRRERLGEDPFYYHFIELGTKRGVKPVRYLTDAVRIAAPQALRAMEVEGRKQIDRAYRRQRGRS